MAIAKVRIKLNGTWTNLTKNASTGKWEGTITAPATTSYTLSGGYYPVTVEATNEAGTVTTKDAIDAGIGEQLRLIVQEKIKPVISLTVPGNNAYVKNNQQPIQFRITDEIGGSGIDINTLKLRIDGKEYTSSDAGMVLADITGGYDVTYTPQEALSDGEHTLTINVSDNDGNVSNETVATYTIDTTPPALLISAPQDGLITNNPQVTVFGTTNDATSSPITLSVALDGTDMGDVAVSPAGEFSKTITLAEGVNIITVTATDSAGQKTSIGLHVMLDTSIPVISSVELAPNPVGTSTNVAINIEVK